MAGRKSATPEALYDQLDQAALKYHAAQMDEIKARMAYTTAQKKVEDARAALDRVHEQLREQKVEAS